jgi:imidazolonepropionase-like amidohydrolase
MDEADQQGVPTVVHVTEVNDMMETVRLGAERLVHTPHTGTLAGTGGAELVKESGIPVSSTLGVWVPMYLDDDIPRFRNGSPFPQPGIARAGQGPVNARYLWNAGVTIAFGTDTPFTPVDALAHELRPLRVLFSPTDIVAMLTSALSI